MSIFKSFLFAIIFLLSFTISTISAQTCGNGLIEGGEDCDDGDTNNNDGCSSSCETEPAYRCGCASPSTSFGASQSGGMLGGMGGGPNGPLSCDPTDAMIGLAFDVSNGQQNVTRTNITCGTLSVDQNGVVSTTQSDTYTSGGSGCGGWDPSTPSSNVTCPNGYVITGITGLGLGGTLFSDVTINCNRILSDGSISQSEATTIFISGSEGAGTNPQTALCPDGMLAQAFETRSGCGQDALVITCAPVTFNCLGQISICTANEECGDGVIQGDEICEDGNDDSLDGCSSTCQLEGDYRCVSGPLEGPCETTGAGSISANYEELGCTNLSQFDTQIAIDGSAQRLRNFARSSFRRAIRFGENARTCKLTSKKLREQLNLANSTFTELWTLAWGSLLSLTSTCDRGLPPACTEVDQTTVLDEMRDLASDLFNATKKLQCYKSEEANKKGLRTARRLRNQILENIDDVPNPTAQCTSVI
jgi:cysteine-rich repeat protein